MEEIGIIRSGRTAGDARPRTRPEEGTLLERLKAATGPDRALDRELMLFEVPEFPREVADLLEDEHFTPITASLDAALALAERMLPDLIHAGPSSGWKIGLYRGMTPTASKYGFWRCTIRQHAQDGVTADAPTPALAVLIALLSALPADGAPLRQDETDASPRGAKRSEGMDT